MAITGQNDVWVKDLVYNYLLTDIDFLFLSNNNKVSGGFFYF